MYTHSRNIVPYFVYTLWCAQARMCVCVQLGAAFQSILGGEVLIITISQPQTVNTFCIAMLN